MPVVDLVAFHNYVVIEIDRDLAESVSEQGLVLPEGHKEVASTGVITSIGPEAHTTGLAVGTRVLFPPYGIGEVCRFGNSRYMIMLDHQLFGSIEE